MIETEQREGSLVALEVAGVDPMDHLSLAGKPGNKGQGLRELVAMLMVEELGL